MKNEPFRCVSCSEYVPEHPEGSARNHCPFCLASLHLDAEFPGDRASDCGGVMPAVDLDVRKGRGYVIVHECSKCGKRIANKTASDDELLPFVSRRSETLARGLPPRDAASDAFGRIGNGKRAAGRPTSSRHGRK